MSGALDMSVEELLESVQRDPKSSSDATQKTMPDRAGSKDSPRYFVRHARDDTRTSSMRVEAPDSEDGKDGDDKASANGSVRSRRHRSPEDRHRDSRERRGDSYRSGGDFYRGGGRGRTRSPSGDDRHYRPSNGSRRDRDDRGDRRRDRGDRPPARDQRDRDSHRGPRGRNNSPNRARTPEPTDDERDRRTVFVQQLAARLRTRELEAFFSKVGPVKEAQIVKDRVSGRSKGYVIVDFVITIAANINPSQRWIRRIQR